MNKTLFARIGSFLKEGRRRKLSPFWNGVVVCMVLGLAGLELYGAPFGMIDAYLLRVMFVGFVLALTFICYTPTSAVESRKPYFFDLILSIMGFAAAVYIFMNGQRIITRWTGVDPMTPGDIFFTVVIVLLVIEATRRTVGPVLVFIILLFVAYNFAGKLLPGSFGHRGMTIVGFLDRMVYTFDGIFTTPIGVTCTYVYMFILFGQVFNEAGGGNFFFRLASSIAGRMRGGPAKIAVIASALYGTMSGSPTSDVVTTGSITIPLMKRLGYSRVFAGAVEAAASSGASILPPIMGTAAFLMVDIAGIPYIEIIVAAAVPAVIYYIGIMLQVHYRSIIKDLRPIAEEEQREKPWAVLKENFHYLIPIVVLIWLIERRLNPTVVGLAATCTTIVISWFKPGYRMGPQKIATAFYKTGTGILTVANASAAAGMVIGGIMLTGLGGKFTSMVFQATGGVNFFCLLMVAVVCIILGMGMPIPAAYVLTATLAVPALLELDFPLLASHLFIVYFSMVSAVTPPVAVAAYAASGIAGGNPNSTGFQATRLAIAAYLVPIIFMYRPGLLMAASLPKIIWSTLMTTLAVIALASGLEGHFFTRLNSLILRFLFIGVSIMLVWPHILSDLLGLAGLAAIFGWQVWMKNRRSLAGSAAKNKCKRKKLRCY
ncbi:MAG: TRAP transporter fused permease subunit [Pseudomonadota bacterium]